MDKTNEQKVEHIGRINFGEKAKNGLDSEFWKKIVKPIINSMLIGLQDSTTIDLKDMSDRDIAVEVKARKIAKDYVNSIEELIKEHVIDADSSKRMLNPKGSNLYKVNK